MALGKHGRMLTPPPLIVTILGPIHSLQNFVSVFAPERPRHGLVPLLLGLFVGKQAGNAHDEVVIDGSFWLVVGDLYDSRGPAGTRSELAIFSELLRGFPDNPTSMSPLPCAVNISRQEIASARGEIRPEV